MCEGGKAGGTHLGTVVRMTKWVRKNPSRAVGLESSTLLQTSPSHACGSIRQAVELSTSPSPARPGTSRLASNYGVVVAQYSTVLATIEGGPRSERTFCQ